ncbi:MAG: NAD(P)H-hydrate dehydratase [Planctomycetota bacterium]|nr:NAD(P)H-hydrate dehydratase [Planctomycetota bacterium]
MPALKRTQKVPALPRRARDAHKGSCGRVLIVGGSRGMAGAPCLAARGALRGGAGLVKVVVPECIWDVVAAKLDECTTGGRPATKYGTFARSGLMQIREEEQAWHDVTVLGPGLGGCPETDAETRRTVGLFFFPLVLDASGLNAFPKKRLREVGEKRRKTDWLKLHETWDERNAPEPGPAPLVLTPHPGEAARLLGTTIGRVQKDRVRAARELVELAGPGAVTLLKGSGTVVTDGKRLYINATGNPGMATGGSGDVLSGLIGALLGQRMGGFEAAVLGVYLHGLAGDLAAKKLGEHSLVAGDLIEFLPQAFLKRARLKA